MSLALFLPKLIGFEVNTIQHMCKDLFFARTEVKKLI
jgi:hypothetical protein